MKKWLSLLIVVTAMLFLSAGMVHAAKSDAPKPNLILDGKVLKSSVPPVLIGESVMIPIRIVTENLGYKVNYDNKQKKVMVSNGTKELVMTLDKPTAFIDNEPFKMVTPPTLISSKTLIPIRFLGESLGVQVFWDNTSKSAFLYTPEAQKETIVKPEAPGGEIVSGIKPDGAVKPAPSPAPSPTPVIDEELNPDLGVITNPIDPALPGDSQEPSDPLAPTAPIDSTTPLIPTFTNGTLRDVQYVTDTVIMKYNGEISPIVTVLNNPSRIVIDLPNTYFAPDYIPPLPSELAVGKQAGISVTGHPALEKIRYSIYSNSPTTLRYVLDFNQNWDYSIENSPINGELYLILKQPEPDKSLFTVVLDAGHGGSDPGARGINGRWEKEVNLILVKKVQALLAGEERINLVLTRQDDSYPSLDDRYRLANAIGADLFISVHANSFTAKTNGTETYYTRSDSLAFARIMHPLLKNATGLKDNGVRQQNFKVTRETKMPAILLEIGYLSSSIDNPKIWSDEVQNRIAKAIVTGIKQQLKLA